nr:PREDICTED: testis-expressed sequence 36 protein [Paralichthys olivaceus]
MVKGGKQYSSMSNDGKWFAHSVLPETERRDHETCTSTGIMLSQVKSSLPQVSSFKHYPKWKSQHQGSREYPLSDHDNKHSLKDDIAVFTCGVGRRKGPNDRREHNSHFCLFPDGPDIGTSETGGNLSAYQTDFNVKQTADIPAGYRRFPRNHKQKAAEAASAQAGENFMWFGRHDLVETPLKQAATNSSASSLSGATGAI